MVVVTAVVVAAVVVAVVVVVVDFAVAVVVVVVACLDSCASFMVHCGTAFPRNLTASLCEQYDSESKDGVCDQASLVYE
jgi:hypothetical protein